MENEPLHLYEIRGGGDASRSTTTDEKLKIANEQEGSDHDDLSRIYNRELLSYLTNNLEGKNDNGESDESFILSLSKSYHDSSCNQHPGEDKPSLTVRKLIMAHNLALTYLIRNDPQNAFSVLRDLLQYFDAPVNNDELGYFKSKVAFLVIDCLLALGLVEQTANIITWIEKYITLRDSKTNNKYVTSSQQYNHISSMMEPVAELKFRLYCYKSKILFMRNKKNFDMNREPNTRLAKKEHKSFRETNTRNARKELKNAMEIYHHKLAVKKDKLETAHQGTDAGSTDGGWSIQESVTSNPSTLAANTHASAEIGGCGGGDHKDIRTENEMKKLYSQKQIALYLKSNLEYLKGNTKKSLKLCSEALQSNERLKNHLFGFDVIEANDGKHDEHPQSNNNNANSDDIMGKRSEFYRISDRNSAMYYNNLAIVHHASNKTHIAMHYYSRSLRYMERVENSSHSMNIDADGVANPNISGQILYNASICAFQINEYLLAYECMTRCLRAAPKLFAENPHCWLHLADCCVGIHMNIQSKNNSAMKSEPIVYNPLKDNVDITSPLFGSKEDIDSVADNPLPRAVELLQHCLYLCDIIEKREPSNSGSLSECLETAKVTLAYTWLELGNAASVIKLADQVLNSESVNNAQEDNVSSRRRRISMGMYASEAMCIFGNPSAALKYLTGSESTDIASFDCEHYVTALFSKKKSMDKDDVTTTSNRWERKKINDTVGLMKVALGGIEATLQQSE